MEPQEKLTTQQFIIDRLHDVQRKVESGNIQDGLDELKEVKAADSKNIYIIALEKQISKLTDAATPADLRTEIIKSLPPMIERAISDSQRRLAEKAQEPKESKEKEAALEKLKSQYFQRADEYVEKGDYAHALEEIRRIYIIDPNNVVAKEYEQKIEQLASLKTKSETKEIPSPQAAEQPAKKEQPVPESVETEEKTKSKLPLIAAAAVIVIGIGVWLVLSGGSKETQQQTVAQQEQTVAATPQTAPAEQPPAQTPPVTTKETKGKPEQKATETKQSAPTTPPPAQPKTEQKQAQQPATEQPKATQPQAAATPPPTQQQQTTPAQQQTTPAPAADEGAAPKPFVAIESPPQIVRREAPKYPEIAYRMRIEGKVVVEVTVDPQGKPIQAKVARSSSDVFNDAAIEAAMKSTYKPAMMSTGPVTAKVYVPFDFKLR